MIKNGQFAGLWAIILGGSSGFGLAAAKKLALQGMNIALLYRETAVIEKEFKKELSALAIDTEVTILPYNINALDKAGRELFAEKFIANGGSKHSVKLLLHSIARGNLKPLATEEPAGDSEVLSAEDIVFTTYAMSNSLLDWTRELLKNELFHSDARIIGLTSEGAHKHWEGYAAVSIAKASLESLAKYMAVEFSRFGLKTNLVQAGITDTASLKLIPGSDKLLEVASARNPLGRITQTSDVAKVIYLLCTDDAFWINGSIIHVDGGEHCR